MTKTVVCITVSLYNGKITRKEMSKSFSCHYKRYREMSSRSTGKIDGFDYREEYLISNKILFWQC